MKRSTIAVLVIACVLGTSQSFAQPEEAPKGRSVARERASDNAVFNRISDWFATRGKSPEEAEAIRTQRQEERDAARTRREAGRQKREAERASEKAQQRMRERPER